jgi:glycosyltransferase involved in cell wall biosynthesis
MRVLFFSHSYTPHDFRFLSSLAKSRHEVLFLRLRSDPTGSELRPLPSDVREIHFGSEHPAPASPSGWSRLVPEFKELVARIKPGLIHAGPVQSCGLIAALSCFEPVMIMSWGSDMLLDAERDPEWRECTQTALRRAKWLQCDSDAVRRKVLEFAPIPDDHIVQFPWGVDTDLFSPGPDTLELRGRPGWGDATIVLSTRSWEDIYDIGCVLESFRLARLKEARLRLVLIGGGSQAGVVRDFLRANRLESDVLLAGRLPNDTMAPWFRASDVYLSCSRIDGSSISLLEAMASGLPAVVTDIPGNREWVTQGQNGWLVPAGRAGGFADALLTGAHLEAAERKGIAKGNRLVAMHRANWLANFPRLLDAYDRIAAAHER